ncbi:MAG: glycosyltransferase [Actinomycetia bacterium]|nr:glycosyltransferase [Actinomycetes bacterium]
MTAGSEARAATSAVVVCTYSFDRLGDLEACLDALERQERRPDQTIVVVDHNPELAASLRSTVVTLPNAGQRGLSAARNTGVAATDAELIAFIDDDAVAEPDWLGELLRPFDEPSVAAVGGRIEPNWPQDRPHWFPPHLDWTVGCTNPGLPEEGGPIRNVFGASAAFRRSALVEVGCFPIELGRVGANLAGCEETHVCITIRQTANGEVVYAPRSVVHHRVTPSRARIGYVLHRCIAEGRSKARLADRVGGTDAMADERDYAVDMVRAVVGDVLSGWRQPHRLGRAVVLIVGLAGASLGYAIERIRITGMSHRWG